MTLILSEKNDLFQRFKDKDIGRLLELSVRFKANKHYEKAQIVDLLIKIKGQDIEGLMIIKEELSQSKEMMGLNYADSLLKEKLEAKQESEKSAKAGKGKIKLGKKKKAEPSFGFSEEAYQSMAERIKLNSQRHRDHIKGLQSK